MSDARRTVVTTSRSTAPVEVVWDLLADITTWKDWGRFTKAFYEREGDPSPHGIGAIRRLGFPGYTSREEVVAFEPPTHLGYVLHKGLPLRGYRADVTLTPLDSGTEIEWRSSFRPTWPGSSSLWAGVLRLLLTDFTRSLAKGAASRP